MGLLLPYRYRRDRSPTFVRPQDAFTPQVEVTMTRDVNGWLDRKQGLKWSLQKGRSYLIDEQRAAEFITKGYAQGELPRAVSEGEAQEWRSQMTTISLENQNG